MSEQGKELEELATEHISQWPGAGQLLADLVEIIRISVEAGKSDAADEVASLRAQLAEALAALKGLSDLYGHAWDRVDGALVMMGDSVDRFEKAHADAYDVLNPGALTDEQRGEK